MTEIKKYLRFNLFYFVSSPLDYMERTGFMSYSAFSNLGVIETFCHPFLGLVQHTWCMHGKQQLVLLNLLSMYCINIAT